MIGRFVFGGDFACWCCCLIYVLSAVAFWLPQGKIHIKGPNQLQDLLKYIYKYFYKLAQSLCFMIPVLLPVLPSLSKASPEAIVVHTKKPTQPPINQNPSPSLHSSVPQWLISLRRRPIRALTPILEHYVHLLAPASPKFLITQVGLPAQTLEGIDRERH